MDLDWVKVGRTMSARWQQDIPTGRYFWHDSEYLRKAPSDAAKLGVATGSVLHAHELGLLGGVARSYADGVSAAYMSAEASILRR